MTQAVNSPSCGTHEHVITCHVLQFSTQKPRFTVFKSHDEYQAHRNHVRVSKLQFAADGCAAKCTAAPSRVGRVTFKEPHTTEPVLSLLKPQENLELFLLQNREPRKTDAGSDCSLEARHTVLSRDMQTAELQMALGYCIPECPPATLSSAHHVVYGYNPAENTEDLCVDWWMLLKSTL